MFLSRALLYVPLGWCFILEHPFLCISLLCIPFLCIPLMYWSVASFLCIFEGWLSVPGYFFLYYPLGSFPDPGDPSLSIPLAGFLLLGTISLCSLFHLCHISFPLFILNSALGSLTLLKKYLWEAVGQKCHIFVSLAHDQYILIVMDCNGMRGVGPKRGLLELSCLISQNGCALAEREPFPNLKHKFHLISGMN